MRVKQRLATLVGVGVLLMGGRQCVYAQNQQGDYPPPYQMGTNPSQYQLGASPPQNQQGVYRTQYQQGQNPAPGTTNPAAAFSGFQQGAYPTLGAGNAPSTFSGSLNNPEYQGYQAVIPPAAPQMDPGVYGQMINPYPQISPYENSFSNVYNNGGLWEHTENNLNQRVFFNADVLRITTKQQGGVFGNPGAQSYTTQERSFINSSSSSSSSGSSSSGSSSNTGSQLLQDQGFITQTPAYYAGLANNYNAVYLPNFGDPATTGARFQLGMWNPDDSGYSATFWFGGVASANFNATDGSTQHQNDLAGLEQIIRFVNTGQMGSAPFTLDDVGAYLDLGTKFTPTEILEQNLLNLRGLPVGDGTKSGQTIPYDIFFGLKTTSQQIGTSLDYYFTPIFQRKWIKVNPTAGVTYLNIRETLSFLGIDSGLLYGPPSSSSGSGSAGGVADRDYKAQSFPNGVDDNQDGIIDNAGSIEAGPSSATNSSSSGSGSGSSTGSATMFAQFGSPFALLPATINEAAVTNLVGPDAGLRYQIGSDSFHIIGQTNFGVMANVETISLTGNNIGSTTRFTGDIVTYPTNLTASVGPASTNPRPETQQGLFVATPQNPNPNAFSSSQTHSHASPLMQQSIIAEGQVFKYVPYLNKFKVFNTASLRVGYTLIWVGDVIETNESVRYQGSPMAGLFPVIEPNHASWWTENWNFGMSWQF